MTVSPASVSLLALTSAMVLTSLTMLIAGAGVSEIVCVSVPVTGVPVGGLPVAVTALTIEPLSTSACVAV